MQVKAKSEWAQFLLDQGVLKFGNFTLKDGSASPFFLDFGALAKASAFRTFGQFFAEAIEEKIGLEKVDFLYGPPYKATMLAGATSMGIEKKDLPCLFSRKEKKQHGEGGNVFGHQAQPGESYVLIDDVMSSGGTKVEAIEALEGLNCAAVIVGVDRQHKHEGKTASQHFTEKTGIPVYSITTLSELCESLKGLIDDEKWGQMREFCTS